MDNEKSLDPFEDIYSQEFSKTSRNAHAANFHSKHQLLEPDSDLCLSTMPNHQSQKSNKLIEPLQQQNLSSSIESIASSRTVVTAPDTTMIDDVGEDRNQSPEQRRNSLAKCQHSSYASQGAKHGSASLAFPQQQFTPTVNGHGLPGMTLSMEKADGFEIDEDEDDDDLQPVTKPPKITERKRKQNAIADRFMQHQNQKIIKEGNKIRPEDEAMQSARWLVNQSEKRQIISSPREYQVELFEKAKEKNIIAVLDTGPSYPQRSLRKLTCLGSGKTLIAVLLLRHIFAIELEDRAMGKAKRISFFLVSSP